MAEHRYDAKRSSPAGRRCGRDEHTWEVSNDAGRARPKSYVLEMLPYPSGEPHIGHLKNYSVGDAVAHFHRRTGRRVLHPMGYDAFGLPAENHAINTGQHPRDSTDAVDRLVPASVPRVGHLDRLDARVRDPRAAHTTAGRSGSSCSSSSAASPTARRRRSTGVRTTQTVLANEQVIDGRCERCGHEVEVRQLEQWFFRITDYADRLLDDLDTIEWPEHVKTMQRNWIGRSEGAEVTFRCEELGDRLPGLHDAARHALRRDLLRHGARAPGRPAPRRGHASTSRRCATYVNHVADRVQRGARRRRQAPRRACSLGRTVINPVNGEQLPMYVADYVLMEYGTGAIMAVPGHDERDFAFAQAFGLPIKRVIGRSGRRGAALRRRRPAGQLASRLRRPAQPRGAQADRRLAGRRGQGPRLDQLPPARLAHLAPALLGLPDPDRLLRRVRASCRCPRRSCRSCCPTSRTTSRRAGRRWPPPRTGSTRPARSAAGRPAARPTRWTRSSTPPGTSCATATRSNDEAAWDPAALDDLDARRPVHRRRRARDPAPALRALLRQGAGRHGPARRSRSRSRRLFTQGMITSSTARRCPSPRATWSARCRYVERYGADTARCYILFIGPARSGRRLVRRGRRGRAPLPRRACGGSAPRSATSRPGPCRPADAPEGDDLTLLRKAHWAIDKVTHDMSGRFAFNTAIAAVMELVNEFYALRDRGDRPSGAALRDSRPPRRCCSRSRRTSPPTPTSG